MRKIIQFTVVALSFAFLSVSCSGTGCPTFSQEYNFDKNLKTTEILVSIEDIDDGLN